MNIEDKIALSKSPVQFIAEGNFLKLYNQSLYVVQQLLGFNLKATAKYIKKIDEIINTTIPSHNISRGKRTVKRIPRYE